MFFTNLIHLSKVEVFILLSHILHNELKQLLCILRMMDISE